MSSKTRRSKSSSKERSKRRYCSICYTTNSAYIQYILTHEQELVTSLGSVRLDDNDSYQSLSGTKPSSLPTNFNNEDMYRRKYPELAPSVMNPTLTTVSPNPNPVRSEYKVSPEIGVDRVQRISEKNDFDDFVFLDSNTETVKDKVLTVLIVFSTIMVVYIMCTYVGICVIEANNYKDLHSISLSIIKVMVWQIKHRRYKVEFPYENDQFLASRTGVMGMQFGVNQKNLIMEGFYNNIRTGIYTYRYTYIHANLCTQHVNLCRHSK